MWLLTLVGGALADRADRRQVFTLFQSIQMLRPILLVAHVAIGHRWLHYRSSVDLTPIAGQGDLQQEQ